MPYDKYILGDITFSSKKQILKHIRKILNKYEEKTFIDEKDFKFMYDLLKRHTSAKQKIGCGVKAFYKVRDAFGNHAFELLRVDGTSTDFSFIQCITPRTIMNQFTQACRTSVAEDIMKFKKDFFTNNMNEDEKIICHIIEGEFSYDEINVNHKEPNTFAEIVRQWLKINNFKPEDFKMAPHGDNVYVDSFDDPSISESFRTFHNNLAQLELISSSAHKEITRKQQKERLISK